MSKRKYRVTHGWVPPLKRDSPESFGVYEADSLEQVAMDYVRINQDRGMGRYTVTDVYVHDGEYWWEVKVERVLYPELFPGTPVREFPDD